MFDIFRRYKTQIHTTHITWSITAVDPRHLKDKEYYISLTKNYCVTISIKIISSIHIFILKKQQISESHELKKPLPFLTSPTQKCTQKWLNQLLAFLNLYQHAKNQFVPSVQFWDTVNLESHDQTGHTNFLPCPPKKISSFQLLILSNKVNFRVSSHDWAHPFLTIPTPWTCTSMQKIS